ncbi:MAG: hypothetical protein RIM33_05705 [Alphaproteobacteria bacterium]
MQSTFRSTIKTIAVKASTVIGAAVISVAVSGVAQACLNVAVPAHTMALSVRTLQSDLMVAGLSCNQRELYNGFAVRFRPPLRNHGTELRNYFTRLHGDGANREINTYVTGLANYAAVRHAQDYDDYCGGTERAFRALLVENIEIERVAVAYAMRVSPSLQQEITLASADAGCDVVDGTRVVAADGSSVLE